MVCSSLRRNDHVLISLRNTSFPMCRSNYNGAKAHSSRKLFDDERCRPVGCGKQGLQLLRYRFPSLLTSPLPHGHRRTFACGYLVNSATALVTNEPSRSILPTPTCNRVPALPALSCLLECLSKWPRSIFRGDRVGNHRLGPRLGLWWLMLHIARVANLIYLCKRE